MTPAHPASRHPVIFILYFFIGCHILVLLGDFYMMLSCHYHIITFAICSNVALSHSWDKYTTAINTIIECLPKSESRSFPRNSLRAYFNVLILHLQKVPSYEVNSKTACI
jgi:hypothetical protein